MGEGLRNTVDVLERGHMFGGLVESKRDSRSSLRIVTLQIAVGVHALVLCIILVQNYLEVPPINEPPLQVSFAQISAPPPPPPPPPPKAEQPKVTPEPEVAEPTEMVTPIETPELVSTEAIPVDTPSMGTNGGVEGGVEGGVPGGVALSQSGPYRVGGDVSEPVLMSKSMPQYPRAALAARLQGVVVLEAVIGSDGTVRDVKVLRGLEMGLTEAAIDAVRRWRYNPGTLNGVPVDVYLTVTVDFKLRH